MALVPWTRDVWDNGEDAVVALEGTDDVPDEVIEAASTASMKDDACMVIGHHPYFGWVYRHGSDTGAIAELTSLHACDSSGIID